MSTHHLFKGDAATPSTGRDRALRWFPTLGTCVDCGLAPAVCRHHRDENPLNNAPENVAFLCRKCHAKAHPSDPPAGAANRAKTHCDQGHPLDEANTYVQRKTGYRYCRMCQRQRNRAYEQRRRT